MLKGQVLQEDCHRQENAQTIGGKELKQGKEKGALLSDRTVSQETLARGTPAEPSPAEGQRSTNILGQERAMNITETTNMAALRRGAWG